MRNGEILLFFAKSSRHDFGCCREQKNNILVYMYKSYKTTANTTKC